MMVEMGVDRIHHAFWDDMDPAHRFYEAGNKFENAIHDYYKEVDREIGELLGFADDGTAVLVVSDGNEARMHRVRFDGTSVRANLINVEPDPEHVELGMKVRLATYSIGADTTGTEAISYGFEPAN